MILLLNNCIERERSTIFFDRKQNLAFKIFKSYKHPDIADKACYKEEAYNEWMKQIHLSEIQAHELISKSNVSQYFLKCYKGITIEKVIDKNYTDISGQYLLDCTIASELVEGHDFKQSYPYARTFCLQNKIDLDEIFSELRKIGVEFYRDASIIFMHGKEKMKIVDVATRDYMDFRPSLLNKTDIESNNTAS